MILSEKHKFIFIKGMKVAGTSVEMALSALCGPHDVVTPISPVDERVRLKSGGGARNYATEVALEREYLRQVEQARAEEVATVQHPPLQFYNHMPLREVAAKYPKPLDGFQIVCIERSPYAKVISWANMRLTYGNYRTGGEMRADLAAVRAYVSQGLETGTVAAVRNIDRYRWPDGTLAAKPMRYATLQSDFDAFTLNLGIQETVELPHAKKGLISDRLDPRDILTSDQISRIDALFAEEFDIFGYPRAASKHFGVSKL